MARENPYETPQNVAARASPGRLARRLPRQLDVIVLAAIFAVPLLLSVFLIVMAVLFGWLAERQ